MTRQKTVLCISPGFTKDSGDYDMKKVMKTADIMEIADDPQEYFITQEKPVSIVSNLTSSLKKLDNNTETKKSVTFRHDLITGETYYILYSESNKEVCFTIMYIFFSVCAQLFDQKYYSTY